MQNNYSPNPDQSEPVMSAATITAAVTAVIALLVAFGLELSEGQTAAILGVVAVVGPLVAGWWARRSAYAPATVARLLRR
ncbi:hypothetical protein E0H26_11785 [Micromonospora zingiberis]|uniref:Uncharacterized protein n=1 Tax=Micromonospora zingiberis TaxID=2053011 RepID=A0A4R0GPR8_9ACTN|nr:hypothetical protein [Micromonospora zingiberis]TCB97591.1 hypothetical protein E0H26_11785 [Micromonospora zingiberis]